jgi:paraquat-inducible protein A
MQPPVGHHVAVDACGDTAPAALIACPGCDLLHRKAPLSPGSTARCQRCGHRLYTHKTQGIERALALTLASFVLFVTANTFPFMAIEVQGLRQEISVLSAAIELFHRGMPALGLFAAAVIFVFPLLQLLGMLAVLIPLHRRQPTAMARRAMRLVSALAPWSMMEIYLLGVLVSLVKLAAMAELTLGTAFWAFGALVVTNTWAGIVIDRHCLWEQLEAGR